MRAIRVSISHWMAQGRAAWAAALYIKGTEGVKGSTVALSSIVRFTHDAGTGIMTVTIRSIGLMLSSFIVVNMRACCRKVSREVKKEVVSSLI